MLIYIFKTYFEIVKSLPGLFRNEPVPRLNKEDRLETILSRSELRRFPKEYLN